MSERDNNGTPYTHSGNGPAPFGAPVNTPNGPGSMGWGGIVNPS